MTIHLLFNDQILCDHRASGLGLARRAGMTGMSIGRWFVDAGIEAALQRNGWIK